MATFKAKIGVRNPELIARKLRKENKRIINEWFKQGVKVFIEEALRYIHVDTGMSKASLKPLAVKVDYTYTIIPKRSTAKGAWTLRGEYRSMNYRNIQQGIIAGKKAFTLKQATLDDLSPSLTYKIQVYQWDKNENLWEAAKSGSLAMRQWMKQNKKRLEDEIGKVIYRTTGTIFT